MRSKRCAAQIRTDQRMKKMNNFKNETTEIVKRL